MEMKTTHPFQHFSLAVLALIVGGVMWASPAPAQFDPGETAGVTAGGGAGGLLPISELENQMGLQGTAYLRRGLLPNWQFELNGGFERFLATDSATDVATISGRLLFSPITRSDWNMFLFGGVGLIRYDWDQPEISPLRTPGLDVIGSVPMVPMGTGIQYKLSDNLALEVSIGYEMALSDAVNAVEEGGNDASLQGRVGLTLGSFGPPPVPVAPMPEPVPPPVEEPAPEPPEVVEEPEMEIPAPRVVLFALNSAKLSDGAMGILDEVVMDLGRATGDWGTAARPHRQHRQRLVQFQAGHEAGGFGPEIPDVQGDRRRTHESSNPRVRVNPSPAMPPRRGVGKIAAWRSSSPSKHFLLSVAL